MNPLGVVLAFVGSFMQGVGNLLQKKAQAKDLCTAEGHYLVRETLVQGMESSSEEDDDPDDEDANSEDDLAYVRSPLWRAGFAVFLTGSILGFFAVGLIGPSLLVVISSSSLLTNVLMSPTILKESRRVLDWVSVFLIISGISLAISAMEMGDKQHLSVKQTVDCISSKRAASTWVTLAFLYMGTMLLCRIKKNKPENRYIRALFAVRAGISGVVGVMLATPTSLLLQNPTADHPILFVLAVALVAQVVLDVHIQNRSLKFNGGHAIFFSCVICPADPDCHADMMFHGPVTFVVCMSSSLQ